MEAMAYVLIAMVYVPTATNLVAVVGVSKTVRSGCDLGS